jgi:hypothetical protein
MPQTRLPRFRRAAAIAPMELTPRDRDILKQVQRHRFLRSSHLVSLLGGSRQHILRRLQLLYHHGFVERPRAQLDYFHQGGGSRSLVYGLGNKGAAILKRELALPYHRLKWASTTRDTGRLFLEHTLLIADIMVSLELACRRHGGARLLTGEEMPLPAAAQRQREPFKWSVHVSSRLKCGVIPDQVFALEFGGERQFYFLEADRATMPVMRQNLAQSSFYRKLLAYEATWTQSLHRSRFGFHRFRVLTVTSSPERVQTMVAACRQLNRGQGLFLFTDRAGFLSCPDALSARWRNGKGIVETLFESLGGDRQPTQKS